VRDHRRVTGPGPRWSRKSVALALASALVIVLVVVVVLHRAGASDGYSTIDEGAGDWAYVSIFGFVFMDAIIPLFPCETVLNAASALAADDQLALPLVMLAGMLGAVLGDSALYWLARVTGPRIESQLDRTMQNRKVQTAMAFLGSRAPLLLVVGRYVPGLRFVVNATLGLSAYPYRKFLRWSALGAVMWSIYTCGLAYLVGTSLAGFPLASMVISSTITSIVLLVIYLVLRKSRPGPPPRVAAGT
jgi:membrane-associated protein